MNKPLPPGPPASPEDAGRIFDEPLGEALSRRYLTYALSTITQRALPDVRDGLKPVQRRLLHAMRLLRLDPGDAAKKSARVVGDVIGRFHPHGEVAVYDALVRLAQDFSQRYRLIDGQGNFGNIDGDTAAAQRYTECRLTAAAQILLEGLDEDAVDFRATYDGEESEPVVLPAGFPNLLANGSTGIAVGMATSIPPHNAAELIDACLLMLDRPSASLAEIMECVPGPDFPTGGVIVEPADSIAEAYRTGRGGVRVRAKWEKEDLGRGLWWIVVTEIPYQVKKADLVEALAGLIEAKRAPLLADVRDESAEDVRIVLEPKSRTVDPEALMESLFRLSDLENRFSVNLNVLDARGAPRVMSLPEALKAFLDHRREVLARRARHRLSGIEERLHLLDGLLAVFLDLDEVIRIVRFEDEPKARLIARFSLSEIQAEAILNTRLRQLARIQELELRRERDALAEEGEGIGKLLASEKAQWKLVGVGLRDVRKTLAAAPEGSRRSAFAEAPRIEPASAAAAFVPREPITVVLSERGWIRAQRGHIEDFSSLAFKEGDARQIAIWASTSDALMVLAADGRAFTLSCDKLPSGRGQGEPLRLLVDLEDRVGIVDAFIHQGGARRLLASRAGYGFILEEDQAISPRKGGKQVINVGGSVLDVSRPAAGDHAAVIGQNGKILIFPLSELPVMARGKGVKLQSYRQGGLSDLLVFLAEEGANWIDSAGRVCAWPDWRNWLGRRAGAGKLAPRRFPTSKRFRPSRS